MIASSFMQWLSEVGVWLANNVVVLMQVVASLVTAAATYALWRATKVLAVETTILAKMTAQPFVVSWLESSAALANALNLTLRNTGNATAFDVKLKLSPALPTPIGNPPDSPEETTFETSFLPPGQVLPIQGVLYRNLQHKLYTGQISWCPQNQVLHHVKV